MKWRPEPADIDRFQRVIAERMGLHLEQANHDALAELLRRGVEAAPSAGVGYYLDHLSSPAATRELGVLAEQLTVGETYFFRDPDQLRAFAEVTLAAPGIERIVSAGCASGEEAYSLAILARDRVRASIVGFDVNPAMIAKAVRGRYSAWSFRQTPEDVRARCFRRTGSDYTVVDSLRSLVSFEVRNLLDDDDQFWRAGSVDVVFLRNVTMYFSRQAARAVMARVARALRPGGYLFLGYAESMSAISDDFDLQNTHGTFYYRRRHATPRPRLEPRERPADDSAAAPSAAVPVAAEAPAELGSDRVALLLQAVALTNCGRMAEAEAICRELLASDGANAGARYLLALLCEQAGEIDAAVEHDRAAADLDPSFAMPHLHLGLMARRAGDRRLAQRALEHASMLLAAEDETRILLYGGGFAREGLIELCCAQLRSARVDG
ncbi:MAG: hypothetical protein JWM53_3378 [bacterium]|nr:hypothetical protein [bacterium]